jgi:hypothetical protein
MSHVEPPRSTRKRRLPIVAVRKMSAKCPAMATLGLETNTTIKILHSQVYTSNILRENAKQEEKETIQAATGVVRVSIVVIFSNLKTNFER